MDIVSALSYLHALDPPLLHRDVKPESMCSASAGCYTLTSAVDLGLTLSRSGQWMCKLMDFGESKAYYHSQDVSPRFGTPAFCAPESVPAGVAPLPNLLACD